MKNFGLITALILSLSALEPLLAQDEIGSIPFDTIPPGTVLKGGGSPIGLESDTNVTGAVSATGEVQSATGFRFPDASIQTTAAAGASTTSNLGMYNNRILELTPPNAYTEICIKGGDLAFDIHAASEPTSGGNCVPGDIGWVIERFEREAGGQATWYNARLECLKDDMRLPEPFEWRIACDNSSLFAISDMEDIWEWASNSVEGDISGAGAATITAMIMGNGSCSFGAQGQASGGTGQSTTWEYRCAR